MRDGAHVGEIALLERRAVPAVEESPRQRACRLLADAQPVIDHEGPIQHVDVRTLLERPSYGVQPLAVHEIVVVEIGDQLTSRSIERRVARDAGYRTWYLEEVNLGIGCRLHHLPRRGAV